MPIREDACQGPCNQAARKAQEAYEQAANRHADAMREWLSTPGDDRGPKPEQPAEPGMPVTLGDPTWCRRCARMIDAALRKVDDDAATVARNVDGYRSVALVGPTGRRAPDHTAVIETLDELFGALVEVEDQWRAARGYPARPYRGRGAHARMVSVAWLLEQLPAILLHPGSVSFGLAVLGWQRRLERMATTDPGNARSAIRCPNQGCRERRVRRKDDDWWECDACGRLLTQQEHDREQGEQADEHDRQQVGA
jgi:ribosomal protein L37AE/L43A